MSLKLKKVNTFKVPVTVLQPGSDQEESFTAECKYLDRDAFDALMASQPTDPEFLDEVLVNTTGIQDESKTPVSFDVAKAAIAADMSLSAAVVRAYIETLGGIRAKNSPRSRAR